MKVVRRVATNITGVCLKTKKWSGDSYTEVIVYSSTKRSDSKTTPHMNGNVYAKASVKKYLPTKL
jgi:hypothetical protein